MKKLMIAAAIVCAAAMVQASQFSWSTFYVNGYATPGDDGALVADGTTVYLIDGGAITRESFFNQVMGAGADGYSAMFNSLVASYAINSATVDDINTGITAQTITGTGIHDQNVDEGIASWVDDNKGAGTYTAFEVILDEANKAFLISDIAEAEAKGAGAGEYVFTNPGAYDVEGLGTNPFPEGTTTFQGDGWYTVAVPEPTSGLLLLLGVAGLALRRRRA